jgi:hypothetical protein
VEDPASGGDVTGGWDRDEVERSTLNAEISTSSGHLIIMDPWDLRYWKQGQHWEEFVQLSLGQPEHVSTVKLSAEMGGQKFSFFEMFNIQTVDDGKYPIQVEIVDGLAVSATIFFSQEEEE